jgi:two-component system sensor histidine kinase ChvG
MTVPFGLRGQLLAVASIFLLVPWLGYEYINELERFLRQAQDDSLVATAQAVATSLHDRPQLFATPTGTPLKSIRDVLDQVAANDAARAPTAASTPTVAASPAAVPPEPVDEIQQILRGLERAPSQIWVLDRAQHVRARTGTLRPTEDIDPATTAGSFARPIDWIENALLSPLYRLILRQPRNDFIDDAPPAYSREIETALSGVRATGTRQTADGTTSVAYAVAPIWSGDRVQGVVVAEQTTNSVLRQRNLAFERLLGVLLIVVVIGAALLFVFASRLGRRIRALRDDARAAVDAEGRVVKPLASSSTSDEIGDLSREFAALLQRLADYTQYREHLASRLSHELRTPIAMIRSSLDNLSLAASAAEASKYVDRAHQGLNRLNFVFDAMSEATRLESAIANTTRERFDLQAVVAGCIDGYRTIYPSTIIEATLPSDPLPMFGSPELIAQMLDKLVANAVDFATPGTPVIFALATSARAATLSIANTGPLLPPGMESRLFDSMVSVRATGSGSPHLGLGLYIVRQVVQFHHGEARIANREDGSGIVVTIRLPLAEA